MRKLFIAGNWKMNKTYDEAVKLAGDIQRRGLKEGKIDIAVFVPSLYLKEIRDTAPDIITGAQNIYFEENGAFTGEISAAMIRSVGVNWTLIGHSERRHIFGETDCEVNKKVTRALSQCIYPVVCVGEDLTERERGITLDIVGRQVKELFYGLSREQAEKVIIAYEPVWAIGTGKTASPADAEEVHAYIRMITASLYGKDMSDGMRILYGGSVKPSNAEKLLSMRNIDGALIGGASLKSDDFIAICDTAVALEK